MVIARAFSRVDMSTTPGNSTFLVPTLTALEAATFTAAQIDVLDPLGRLQQYLGSFSFADLSVESLATSVFTGFNQYSTAVPLKSDLSYQIEGVSLNGQLLVDSLNSGGTASLIQTLFAGADQISGSELGDFDDTLVGYGGHDFISGGAGDDSLEGGTGHDTINGNLGRDSVVGGVGDDILRGGKDDDKIFGDIGNDVLNGNLGDDMTVGGLGADTFVLSKGTDMIVDFSAADGDRVAIVASTLPVGGIAASLSDSDEGLLISRDGFGVTAILGWTVATFNPENILLLP